MGWGWKGRKPTHREMLQRPLNYEMKKFVWGGAGIIGCRDWYTVSYLKRQGINNVVMTGCPAWYSKDVIYGNISHRDIRYNCFSKICISDPAFKLNADLLPVVVEKVRKRFPASDIYLIVHSSENRWLEKIICDRWLNNNGITKVCIKGSSDGFKYYDSCDLHIGFRVHAHIYCLSKMRPSVLFNEDARGNGVNDALGIKNINVWRDIKHFPDLNRKHKVIDELYDYLDMIQESEGLQYYEAFRKMRFYYKKMADTIKLNSNIK